MNKKICFVAPSGYGKTTAINIISKFHNIVNIKIASPLYELQDYFYNFIETDIRGEQDGELLQFFGIKIRKENPSFLLDKFKRRLDIAEKQDKLVFNDDCRPPDYDCLKGLGFIFVRVKGFCRTRKDHTTANAKLSIEWQKEIPCDYSVDNFGTMQEYEDNLKVLLNSILKEDKNG